MTSTDLPAQTDRWRPFARAGLISTVLVATIAGAILFVAYGLVEATEPAYWATLAIGSVVFIGWLLLLWRFRDRTPDWALYLIPGGGALIATAFVLAAGMDAELFAIAYALIATVAASMFPRWGQLLLAVVTGAAFVAALLVHDHSLADSILPLGLLAIVGYTASSFARDLQDAIAREASAAGDAERRADLLRAAAAIHDLDTTQAAEAAVQTLSSLGFEIATLAVLDEQGLEMIPLASVGMKSEIRKESIPAGRGLAGQALVHGQTVEVEDYHRFDHRLPGRDAVRSGIAVPIEVEGEPWAVLQGGRRVARLCTPAEREIVEVVAGQVGRAIVNARRFEAERNLVQEQRKLDELKNEFVSNVSHELRTPLTVIQGLGQTLAARRESMDDGQRRQLLTRIDGNASRLGDMIDAMLDFSRFEADGVRPEVQTAHLDRLAELAAERLEPLMTDHEFRVEVVPAEVRCDPSLLEHVIENLLGNAAKHTPPGTSVAMTVRVDGEEVELAVEDQGPGVRPDELPHLTDRFFRGAVDSRHPSPGLGLGLALVQQILAGHGSKLEVINHPGGARFSFRLPLASAGTAASEDPGFN